MSEAKRSLPSKKLTETLSQWVRDRPVQALLTALSAGVAITLLVTRRKAPEQAERQSTKVMPPDLRGGAEQMRWFTPPVDDFGGASEGAFNEIIGGSPEDMNGSPPDVEPDAPRPYYDGSDITRKRVV